LPIRMARGLKSIATGRAINGAIAMTRCRWRPCL
jgi:hypothetical protein